LTSAERTALWRTHLTRFLNSEYKTTSEQRALIEEVLAMLPTLTDTGGRRAVTEARIQERSIALFGAKEAKLVFATLGSEDPAGIDPTKTRISESSLVPTFIPALLSAITKKLMPLDCECAKDSDWCGGSNHCSDQVACTHTSGCGTIFIFTCDGFCWPN